MFEVLQKQYQNLYQELDGRIYALCCSFCGANTGRDTQTKTPTFNAKYMIDHLKKGHLRSTADKRHLQSMTGMTLKEAFETCKGTPVTDTDIERIYRKLPSTVDDRIKVKKHQRGLRHNGYVPVATKRSMDVEEAWTARAAMGAETETPSTTARMPVVPRRASAYDDKDLYDVSKRQRTSLYRSGAASNCDVDSGMDDSDDEIKEEIVASHRSLSVEDEQDGEWSPDN